MSDLDNFRAEARTWVEENCPVSIRNKAGSDVAQFTKKNRSGDALLWLERAAEKGWTAPTWPKKYGGGGLSPDENRILSEELKAINAPLPLTGMSLTMIGPTLLELGTEEQRQRHIPSIIAGETHWCQGYSEPNAGSDLANLQTRAEDNGDHFIVNGSKIWTSGAMYADWMFCLTRTDPNVQKQKGISFLLFPMTDPGVSLRPIRLISGVSPFCQVFFDNVVAKKEDMVGELNQGWTVAKRLLQYERSSLGGGMNHMFTLGNPLVEKAKEYRGDDNGEIDDPFLCQKIIEHEINDAAFAITGQRLMEETMAGQTPGFATSMMKYMGSELIKEKTELMVSVMGPQGLGWDDEENFSEIERSVNNAWLFTKALTIGGGCSEVQLDIISKRILELPFA